MESSVHWERTGDITSPRATQAAQITSERLLNTQANLLFFFNKEDRALYDKSFGRTWGTVGQKMIGKFLHLKESWKQD